MDLLLPSPVGGTTPSPVPYVEGFDSTCMRDFRSLEGMSRDRPGDARPSISRREVSTLPPRQRAACIQAWLFFGLIDAFFRRHMPREACLRNDPMQPSTRVVLVPPGAVSALIAEWTADVARLSHDQRSLAFDEKMALLDFASNECEVLDEVRPVDYDLDHDSRHEIRTLAAVLLSVRLLIAFLQTTVKTVAGKEHFGDVVAKALQLLDHSRTEREWGKAFEPIPSGGQVSLSAYMLLDQFRSNRWCPVRARRLCELYDYSITYYLSRVPRLDPPHVTHQICESQSVCKAYDVGEAQMATYQSKHVHYGCNCRHLHIRPEQLAPIIAAGDIPILSMDPTAPDLDLKIHKFTGVRQYTAISHVWSDGLGNPHSNSLPICQLQKIAKILTNIKERTWRFMYWEEKMYTGGLFECTRRMRRRVYFWMDTFCIPVEVPPAFPSSVHELKLKAIRHITPIFEAAAQVLVLDAELQQLSLRSPDDDEMTADEIARDEEALTAAILGCKWLQRAWTLEEGSIARECHFKVAGEVTTIVLGALKPAAELKKDRKRERRRKRYYKKQRKLQAKIYGQSDTEAANKLVASAAEHSTEFSTVPQLEAPLKLLLAGPLNEERKQAIRSGTGRKYAKQFNKSRARQFLEAWNDLLGRSATKPNDSLIIMANILDFNGASVARIKPAEDRLPTIVHSSLEIPLSLLFNTYQSVRGRQHIVESWIPSAVEGDLMTGDGILSRQNTEEGFALDLARDCKSLRALVTWPKIPSDASSVLVDIPVDGGRSEQFVVEICGSTDPLWMEHLRRAYDQGQPDSSALLMDMSAGSSSVNGYAARGALLSILGLERKDSVLSVDRKELHVRHYAALTFWTCEQWQHRSDVTSLPQGSFRCALLDKTHLLRLEPRMTTDLPLLTQRALLKPRSQLLWTKFGYFTVIPSLILVSVTFHWVWPTCETNVYDSVTGSHMTAKCWDINMALSIIWPIILMLMCYGIWKLIQKIKYRRWLSTFTAD